MNTIINTTEWGKNICLTTDSYKLNHWNQYPIGTQYVYSYFECRKGARFADAPFFGLQRIILDHLVGVVVTRAKIEKAARLCKAHFGNEKYFNRAGWEHILNVHGGKIPIRIRAVEEGTVVPVNNVLMTIENTDPQCYWLTNFLETILTHVWYGTTVAALSREVKRKVNKYLKKNSDGGMLQFFLHDFGYRGASSYETAGTGGAAHLINFLGTDTIVAMETAMNYYNANLDTLAFSVAATEHSIMTSMGADGEEGVVDHLLNEYPDGILSVVADSYDIYNFVDNIVGKKFKDRIVARNGVFVVRPDSITPTHQTPEEEMVWIIESLWKNFGGTVNSKGYKVINPKVRVLWGDGIDIDGIEKILIAVDTAGFATENIACFGMGGGLLQKVNRDTQRCAFKSSAQCRNGVWYDIFKNPKDATKASKKGKLKLTKINGEFVTVIENEPGEDYLKVVFENGELVKFVDFDTIRKNAAL
jgi:nicotinamide phosphoribosyltransferase